MPEPLERQRLTFFSLLVVVAGQQLLPFFHSLTILFLSPSLISEPRDEAPRQDTASYLLVTFFLRKKSERTKTRDGGERDRKKDG